MRPPPLSDRDPSTTTKRTGLAIASIPLLCLSCEIAGGVETSTPNATEQYLGVGPNLTVDSRKSRAVLLLRMGCLAWSSV